MSDGACEQARERLPELALGVVGGRERADVLAHLGHCRACSEEARQLSALGDALIDLVAASEPPVGFENRVLSRPGDRPAARRVAPRRPRGATHRTLRSRLVLAAVVFLAGFALNHELDTSTPRPTPTAGQSLQHVDLLAAGRRVGDIFLYRSAHPWVYVDVHGLDAATRSLDCVLTFRDGRSEKLGVYPISSGLAAWGSGVPGQLDGLVGARLDGPDGTTIATATL